MTKKTICITMLSAVLAILCPVHVQGLKKKGLDMDLLEAAIKLIQQARRNIRKL